MPLSDKLLASGCVKHIENDHGETITILSGPDAGKKFVAVRENESDFILPTELSDDPRAKRMLRFREGAPQGLPNILGQDVIQTEDGKTWNATRNPQDGYLTVDYVLKEKTDKDS